jgi:hypothetical protein
MAGMHKEEVLARLAAHEAPISFLPLDYLRALLHQSLRAAVETGSHTEGKQVIGACLRVIVSFLSKRPAAGVKRLLGLTARFHHWSDGRWT